MKLWKRLILIFIIAIALSVLVLAHPGNTDSKGGHTNSSTGEYHYHHGYPAHQHTGGVCPYDFDDQTGKSSGTSSKTASGQAHSENEKQKRFFDNAASLVLLMFVSLLCAPFVLQFIFVFVDCMLHTLFEENVAVRIYRVAYWTCVVCCELLILAVFMKN